MQKLFEIEKFDNLISQRATKKEHSFDAFHIAFMLSNAFWVDL